MAGEARSPVGDLVSTLVGAVRSVPGAVGTMALGTGAFLGRQVVRLVSGILPASPPAEPSDVRPNAGKIRESAKAAERAARASGLLRPRARR